MNNNKPKNTFCGQLNRREYLHQMGGGFTSLAMAGLLAKDGFIQSQAVAADGKTPWANPLAPKDPPLPAKAKNVIYLFMYGGPSQMDLFDYKPELAKHHGKTIDIEMRRRSIRKEKILGPVREFKRRGQSGLWCSDAFPNTARHMDKMAVIKALYMDSFAHGSANIQMNSGRVLQGHPALGAWIAHGLGSANKNLPSFVVMLDPRGGPIPGAANWTSGYMPAAFQGVTVNASGTPILDLKNARGMSREEQRAMLDTLNKYNSRHLSDRTDNSNLSARIASYELAYKMQMSAPEAVDFDSEPQHVKNLYGLDHDRTRDFGKKCLLARRLVERGVRFIQIYSGGNHNDANWDAHGDLEKNHNYHAGNTDKPIAGLLEDLQQRGMLDETLIFWGGEFGRQPTAEYAKGTGRDHNSYGFTTWMAGGGIKGGMSVGQTDELGSAAVEKPFHVKHMHATVLKQLGFDPNHLSYFYRGLDQKLVGVEGAEPIRQII